MEMALGPGVFVLDGDPALLSKKWGTASHFSTMSVVAKRLDESICLLVRR